MPLLILFLIAIIAVWGCALLRIDPVREKIAFFTALKPIPMLTLAIIIVGAVFGHDFFHIAKGPIPITLDRLLFGGALVLAGWFYLTNREDLRPINRLDVAMICLVGVLFLSTITHDFTFLNNMPASRLLFFNLIPFGVYMLARTAKLGERELVVITVVFGAFSVYLALTAIAEMKSIYALVFPKYIINSESTEFFGRGRGPFLNPVSNGIFQLFGLASIWLWWPKLSSSMRGRVLVIGLSVLISAGVYATLTRSVWMSLVLMSGLMVWLPSRQRQKGLLIVGAFLVVLVAIPVLGDKLNAFKRDKEVTVSQMSQSAELRPLFLTVAWRMFEDRPLFGCGFGQYPREKYPYLQDPYTGKPLSMTKYYMQHNVFLAYLTETGLIGLLFLLLMMAMMLEAAWRLWWKIERTLLQRQFGMLLAALLMVYCVNGMFHDTSIMPMTNMLLFFTAAIVNNLLTAVPEPMKAHESAQPTRVPNARSEPRKYPAVN